MTGAEFEKEYREMYYVLLNGNLIDESLRDSLREKAYAARDKSLGIIAKYVIEQLRKDINSAAEHGYMTSEFDFETIIEDCDLIQSSGYDAEYLHNSYKDILGFVKLWANKCHLDFEKLSTKSNGSERFRLSWGKKV